MMAISLFGASALLGVALVAPSQSATSINAAEIANNSSSRSVTITGADVVSGSTTINGGTWTFTGMSNDNGKIKFTAANSHFVTPSSAIVSGVRHGTGYQSIAVNNLTGGDLKIEQYSADGSGTAYQHAAGTFTMTSSTDKNDHYDLIAMSDSITIDSIVFTFGCANA